MYLPMCVDLPTKQLGSVTDRSLIWSGTGWLESAGEVLVTVLLLPVLKSVQAAGKRHFEFHAVSGGAAGDTKPQAPAAIVDIKFEVKDSVWTPSLLDPAGQALQVAFARPAGPTRFSIYHWGDGTLDVGGIQIFVRRRLAG